MKIGDKVETIHGKGEIVSKEEFRTCFRWGVKLEINRFDFPVAFYFPNELKIAIDTVYKK